jgi:hypothetical protein
MCISSRSIQDEPPTLKREGGAFKYSRAFKEVIDSCLAKDPSKRYVGLGSILYGSELSLLARQPSNCYKHNSLRLQKRSRI